MKEGGIVLVGKLDRAVWLMQSCRSDGKIQNLVLQERRPAPPHRRPRGRGNRPSSTPVTAIHRTSGRIVDQALVRFGLLADSFDKSDVGLKRANADVFAINGCPHANVAAAASKWIHMYRSEARLSPQTINPTALDKATLYEFYETPQNFSLSVPFAHLFMRNRLPTPNIAVAAHYLFFEFSRMQADS